MKHNDHNTEIITKQSMSTTNTQHVYLPENNHISQIKHAPKQYTFTPTKPKKEPKKHISCKKNPNLPQNKTKKMNNI